MNTENETNVRLEGHLDVPNERLAEVTEALAEHIALTQAERGCIEFNLAFDPDIPGRLLVSELFIDDAAFAYHQNRTRSSMWAKITDGIERHYSITKQPSHTATP